MASQGAAYVQDVRMAQVENEPPGMGGKLGGRTVMIKALLVFIAFELILVYAMLCEMHEEMEDLKILLRGLKK